MSKSKKARKVIWYKRWPDQPCIRCDLVTVKGTIVSVTKALTPDQTKAILSILFPEKPRSLFPGHPAGCTCMICNH